MQRADNGGHHILLIIPETHILTKNLHLRCPRENHSTRFKIRGPFVSFVQKLRLNIYKSIYTLYSIEGTA